MLGCRRHQRDGVQQRRSGSVYRSVGRSRSAVTSASAEPFPLVRVEPAPYAEVLLVVERERQAFLADFAATAYSERRIGRFLAASNGANETALSCDRSNQAAPHQMAHQSLSSHGGTPSQLDMSESLAQR